MRLHLGYSKDFGLVDYSYIFNKIDAVLKIVHTAFEFAKWKHNMHTRSYADLGVYRDSVLLTKQELNPFVYIANPNMFRIVMHDMLPLVFIHSLAVILHGKMHRRFVMPSANLNHAAVLQRFETVNNGIFYDGLKE